MLKKIHHPSPNFDKRAAGIPLDLIVLHYTDLQSAEEALAKLCDPEAKVSAHFLIHKDGTLFQLVDPKHRAWHAGLSYWAGETDINSRSIGIELDNLGHAFGPEPFPASQMRTLFDLLEELTKTYKIPPHRIVGHSDVAPLRKADPGEWFPWAELASKGFGHWPDGKPGHTHVLTILELQRAFCEVGYDCPQTGVWDEDCQAVCLAFQRHYTPEELTGNLTDLTHHALQGLLVKN